MGACMSSGPVEISEEDKRLHREAEKSLKEVRPLPLSPPTLHEPMCPYRQSSSSRSKSRCVFRPLISPPTDVVLSRLNQVLLLGSGDSGKSTILKQMRLIHRVPFSSQEIESYRQLVFNNLTHGLKYVIDAMDDMELEVLDDHRHLVTMVEEASDIKDGEPFPEDYLTVLKQLWEDPNVQAAYARGNEAALPEKCVSRHVFTSVTLMTFFASRSLNYYFADLDRLFEPSYVPNEQDIVHARARTIGITETVFTLRDHDMLMVDVGGQKSERRKWIHCFQDVTSILFLVSLSGYDQCLVEDKDAVRHCRCRVCPHIE